VRNCIISENTAFYGGGVYCWDSCSPAITGNTFRANTAIINGGAMYFYNTCSALVTNNVISGNTARDSGGGVAIDMFSDLFLANNLFYRNTTTGAFGSGGAVYAGNSSPRLVNDTITANSATLKGGSVDLWYSSPSITNCILWSNTSGDGAEISHEGSTLSVEYSCVTGGWAGEGVLDTDPLFQTAAEDDYRLSGVSPLIGAGTTSVDMPDLDLAGNPRPQPTGSQPDIGAFESPL
jgi:hypothetical protein